MNGFLRRLNALTIKEIRQISRDPSSIMIGIALPIILILIFGYGLSLDVKNAPVAVVMEKSTPLARDVLAGLNGSAYFSPRYAASMHEAEAMLKKREVDAIIRTGSDFDSRFARGDAEVQLILHGVDSTTATLIGQYVSALLSLRTQISLDRQGKSAPGRVSGMALFYRYCPTARMRPDGCCPPSASPTKIPLPAPLRKWASFGRPGRKRRPACR